MKSLLLGPKGNKEFFFLLGRGNPASADQVDAWIEACTAPAAEEDGNLNDP
jgi:hypothetical protein